MVNTASKTATKPKWLTNPKQFNTKKATLTGGFFYALILSFGHASSPMPLFEYLLYHAKSRLIEHITHLIIACLLCI